MPQSSPYTLWIEAEAWLPGSWVPDDTNTDVFVTFDDGSRWVASFFTYANICTVTQKNRQTGECLSGAYFWSSDMILIDEISRSHIEAVIAYLIREGEFEAVFTRLPPDDSEEEDVSDLPT